MNIPTLSTIMLELTHEERVTIRRLGSGLLEIRVESVEDGEIVSVERTLSPFILSRAPGDLAALVLQDALQELRR